MIDEDKNEIVRAMMDVEMVPSFDESLQQAHSLHRVSLTELSAGGMGLMSLVNTIQGLTSAVPLQSEQLYRFNSHGLEGVVAARHDGSGFTTAIVQPGKGIVGNGSYQPIDASDIAQAASTIDPYMLMMSAALMGIEQELGQIRQIAEQILSFMEEDKKAAIRGNMNVLADIMNNYKHNIGNERFRETRHTQVLDIRRDAEKDIEFYRAQIRKTLDEGGWIHVSAEVAEEISKLNSAFGDYQSSLYLYGFSTFLEVMLLENFEETYLDSVAAKLEDYSLKYRELYTEASNKVEESSKTSVRAGIFGGLSAAGHGLGDLLSSAPLLDQTPVGGWLKESGETLSHFNDDLVQNDVNALTHRRDSCITPFQQNISKVRSAFHGSFEAYTDGNDIWFALDGE